MDLNQLITQYVKPKLYILKLNYTRFNYFIDDHGAMAPFSKVVAISSNKKRIDELHNLLFDILNPFFDILENPSMQNFKKVQKDLSKYGCFTYDNSDQYYGKEDYNIEFTITQKNIEKYHNVIDEWKIKNFIYLDDEKFNEILKSKMGINCLPLFNEIDDVSEFYRITDYEFDIEEIVPTI